MREINQAGLDLLKRFESCRLNAYQDVAGIWTIGYGHVSPDINSSLKITQEEADNLLKQDLEKFYHLDDYLSEQVNENQYSALICLAYNIGLRALKLSTVIKKINNGDKPDSEWMQYIHARINGEEEVIQGLVNRRKAELKLFNMIG